MGRRAVLGGHQVISSPDLAELNAALSKAQGEFEAVDKSASNPFFRSAYAPLPEVVKAAAPILTKHGLAVWQGADTDEKGELLWTVVLHSSGQYIGSAARMLPVPAKQYDKDGNVLAATAQDQGSAITYQRRYQYMAALGLVADEDDDGNAATRARSKPPARKETRAKGNTPPPSPDGHSGAEDASAGPVTEDTLKALATAYKAAGIDKTALRKITTEAGLASGKGLDELSEDQATWVVLKLQKTKVTSDGQ
jgi:hypothetical protein